MTSNTERTGLVTCTGCLSKLTCTGCLSKLTCCGWCSARLEAACGHREGWHGSEAAPARSRHRGSHQPAGRQGWTLHCGYWDGHSGHTAALWDLSYLWTFHPKQLLHYFTSMIPQTWPTSKDYNFWICSNLTKIMVLLVTFPTRKCLKQFYDCRKNLEEGTTKCPP